MYLSLLSGPRRCGHALVSSSWLEPLAREVLGTRLVLGLGRAGSCGRPADWGSGPGRLEASYLSVGETLPGAPGRPGLWRALPGTPGRDRKCAA